MMRSIFLGLGLLAAAPAQAARHEVSFEFNGTFADQSPGGIFPDALPAFGFKAGGAVIRNGPGTHRFGLVIDGAWNRSARSAYVSTQTSENTGYVGFGSVLTVDTIAVGAKADVSVADMFFPYIHVQAALLHGQVRSDNDVRDSVAPYSDAGVGAAGIFTVGFELGPPDTHLGWPVTFALYFEAGGQIASDMYLGELGGPVNLSGAIVRSGVGLRF